MNVIGLKKCPKCGHKELYGCHNYYTIGAPFKCPKCGSGMDYSPFRAVDGHLPDEAYQKTWDFLQANIATLDFKIIELKPGHIRIEWTGLPAVNEFGLPTYVKEPLCPDCGLPTEQEVLMTPGGTCARWHGPFNFKITTVGFNTLLTTRGKIGYLTRLQYIYQCLTCGRTFETMDAALDCQHKLEGSR